MRIEIFYREILHPVEHLAAQLVKKALRYLCHELCLKRYEYYRKYIEHYQNADDRQYFRFCRYPSLGEKCSVSLRKFTQ